MEKALARMSNAPEPVTRSPTCSVSPSLPASLTLLAVHATASAHAGHAVGIGNLTYSTKVACCKPASTPPTSSPSQIAPSSRLAAVSRKPSISPMGAQELFDEMALQQDAFVGGAQDDKGHDHNTATSNQASSIVGRKAEVGDEYMLKELPVCPRRRDHYISKASAKRRIHLRWKHSLASYTGADSGCCVSGTTMGEDAAISASAINNAIFREGDVVLDVRRKSNTG